MRGRILDDIYEKLGLNRTAEAPEDAPEGPRPSGRWRRRPSGSLRPARGSTMPEITRVRERRGEPGSSSTASSGPR